MSDMKERPIPFSAPMIRALLAGTKTQTRRVVKPEVAEALDFLGGSASDPDAPGVDLRWGEMQCDDSGDSGKPQWLACCADYPEEGFIELGNPYGKPGDRLWVREAWRAVAPCDDQPPRDIQPNANWLRYEADATSDNGINWGKLRPGMFMPRWASRITLEVTGVRVERLQDISEAHALAEGIVPGYGGFGLADGSHFHSVDPRQSYLSLWEAINGAGSVEANPWVWVVEFNRAAAVPGSTS
jgi:hypothetical protein